MHYFSISGPVNKLEELTPKTFDPNERRNVSSYRKLDEHYTLYNNLTTYFMPLSIEIHNEYQEPQESNGFVLRIIDHSASGIITVLSKESSLYPGMKMAELLEKIIKIKYIFKADKMIIPRNQLKCVPDLLKLDDKVFDKAINDVRENTLGVLHRSLFYNNNPNLYTPLLSPTLYNRLLDSIETANETSKALVQLTRK